MNWFFSKSKSTSDLDFVYGTNEVVEVSRLGLANKSFENSVTVHYPGNRRSSVCNDIRSDTMDQIIELFKTEDDLRMCLCICESHGVSPGRLVVHWRKRLNRTVQCANSEKTLACLCLELKNRRIRSIARDFETGVCSFDETESECKRFGVSVGSIAEHFNPAKRFPEGGRVAHYARLMHCILNRCDSYNFGHR